MADEGANAKEVFRRSTMNRISSADELDHYIKVTNPSAWVITIAAILLVAGVIGWAVIAIVPVTVNTTGVAYEIPDYKTTVLCWVDKATADKIEKSGTKASIDGVEAKSVTVDHTPMSSSEVVSFLGNKFYLESIDISDWNYLVAIEPGEEPKYSEFTILTEAGEAHLVPVSIVVSETRPINIILGNE